MSLYLWIGGVKHGDIEEYDSFPPMYPQIPVPVEVKYAPEGTPYVTPEIHTYELYVAHLFERTFRYYAWTGLAPADHRVMLFEWFVSTLGKTILQSQGKS